MTIFALTILKNRLDDLDWYCGECLGGGSGRPIWCNRNRRLRGQCLREADGTRRLISVRLRTLPSPWYPRLPTAPHSQLRYTTLLLSV